MLNDQWLTLTKSLRDDIPTGPVASWTEHDHQEVKALVLKCHLVFGPMATSNPLFPEEHKAAFSRWMGDMAILHVIPDDYPGYSDLVASVRSQYAALEPFIGYSQT